MKALICGNAPCFIDQTKGKDLSEFFVVRMNGFIDTPELPVCDAWSSWPDPSHRVKHARHEPIYDVAKYAAKTKELWLCHPGVVLLAKEKFKRDPDYFLPAEESVKFTREMGSNPNMGMLMIKAAMLQPRFTEIWVCGFDHYQGPNDYYFIEGKFDHPAHVHEHNEIWFNRMIGEGRIFYL